MVSNPLLHQYGLSETGQTNTFIGCTYVHHLRWDSISPIRQERKVFLLASVNKLSVPV
jgi:hypothetical protein